jgi:glycosyltransferase involved in cell wall biosynthesis
MKLALIQDQLLTTAGSERVFLYMVEEFAGADIFTLAYNPENTLPEFTKYQIKTSWMDKVIDSHNIFKILFPISTYVMQYMNLTDYDIIVSSSASIAKYISQYHGHHICYCYFPTRAIWNNDNYFRSSSNLASMLFNKLLPYFKRRDYGAAQRIDHFIAISKTSQRAIRNFYHRESEVLYCPIDYEKYSRGLTENKEDYFLIVSRLEKWKRVDYAIEAFNKLGLRLLIIGIGEDEKVLKAMANDNIEFLGWVEDEMVTKYFGRAQAVIFTPELEYGLVPLEANAAGTPVIALGRGGVQETMIPANGLDQIEIPPTAIFFQEQTSESLIQSIKLFEKTKFNREAISEYAKNFDIPIFKKKLRELVESLAINYPPRSP